MDHFAAVFTMVDGRVFQDVLQSQMSFLFKQMVTNQSAISIPQHFLANPGVSRMFAELLLDFLMKRIGYVSFIYLEPIFQLYFWISLRIV